MLFTRIRLWLRSFVKAETTCEGRERVRRIRPMLEGLEDRVLLNGQSLVPTLTSPPVAETAPQMVSVMNQESQTLVTLAKDVSTLRQVFFQEITQKTAYILQQWEHLLGINGNASAIAANAVEPQRDNSSDGSNGSAIPRPIPTASQNGGGTMTDSSRSRMKAQDEANTSIEPFTTTTESNSGSINPYYGQGYGTVSGTVWLDSNNDGLLDNGETGVPGVTVYLCNAQGQEGPSTTTDANGNYQFQLTNGLWNLPNQFEIQVVFPSGDAATTENVSGSGINSNINAQGYSAVFTLAANGTQQVNAGLVNQAFVNGEVWQDSNSDGLLDNGESGVSGVTVYLDNSSGTTLLTTTTDANGNYQFNVGPTLLSQYSSFETQVEFPTNEFATTENVSGSYPNSNIDANGFANAFALAAGGNQKVNAGLVPFLVIKNKDDGTGGTVNTLSWCIDQIKNGKVKAGTEIDFNINGNTLGTQQTIDISGAEPTITVATTINGWSQSGQSSGTDPWIELDAGGNGFTGLSVTAGQVVIEGLAIASFGSAGIDLNDPGVGPGQGDTVLGCNIGTDLAGTDSTDGNNFGITIEGSNNIIGGESTNGNLISGNKTDGINISGTGANQNVVINNTIGVDSSGVTALPNSRFGVDIANGASNNTIGGSNSAARRGNVISGNGSNGINIMGLNKNAVCNNNSVDGNSIGVAFNGSLVLGNKGDGVGLGIDESMTFIGGRLGSGTANVISGNGGDGIGIGAGLLSQNNDTIIGNTIGVTSDGSSADPNLGNGISINQVVGTNVEDNVISGNTENGLQITGDLATETAVATETTVTGNTIGATSNGGSALGNGWNGIYLDLADQNTIGEATEGPSNVISGNKNYGIEIGSSKNLVVNNYIGTDNTGKRAIGNSFGGVNIGWSGQGNFWTIPTNIVATNNTIGGTGGLNSTLNVISANLGGNGSTGDGISLAGSGVTGTLIAGNYIGVDVTGLNPLGNQNSGIAIESAVSPPPTNTTVGIAGANGGNVISANQGKWGYAGLQVDGGTGVYQNNMIGFNSLGKDPTVNKDFKNKAGEVSMPANGWTDGGGNLVQ